MSRKFEDEKRGLLEVIEGGNIIEIVNEDISILVLAQLSLCIWHITIPLLLLIHHNIYLWKKSGCRL